MHLQVSPDAPVILRFGAAALLTAHIGGGAVGMASGFVAMLTRKGGAAHRAAGNVFCAAMLTMAGVGASVALFMADAGRWTNVLAGTFTCYLVITAWAAVRRRAGEAGRFEAGALAVAVCGMAAAFGGVWLNTHAAHPARGPEEMGLYVFGLIASFAAAGDLHLVLRGGLRGPARLARHLWRMGVALTIATGSFFLGQPAFLPAAVRDTFLPFVPVLAGLILMFVWLVLVRLPKRAARPIPAIA